jgi:hypothetical protein
MALPFEVGLREFVEKNEGVFEQEPSVRRLQFGRLLFGSCNCQYRSARSLLPSESMTKRRAPQNHF